MVVVLVAGWLGAAMICIVHSAPVGCIESSNCGILCGFENGREPLSHPETESICTYVCMKYMYVYMHTGVQFMDVRIYICMYIVLLFLHTYIHT